ncbi:MAG: histidine kinase, partial [Chloroflexi bacterium]|nr:histidine kinase [Chloroflexota bacterium]
MAIAILLLFPHTITKAQSEENPTPFPPQFSNQDLQFEHITTDDGLSSNEVLSLLQERNGFIWIGTFNGLNRYDGHTITVYKNKPDDPNSISSNIIRAIHEDAYGILWIATSNGGLNRFDPATQTFSHFLNDPEDPNSLSDNSIISLFEDSDGILWLGTLNNGLERFDPDSKTFSHYPQLGDGTIQRIIEDSAGNLWFSIFGGGLGKLNPETGLISRYHHNPENPASLSTDKIRWVYEDTAGNLWIAAQDGGLDKLDEDASDPQDARFIHYQHDYNDAQSIFEGLISRVFEDSSGTLWVGGSNGLAQFNPSTGQFSHYQHDPNEPNSLGGNVITAFIEDQSGILWFGTFGGGISKHNPATERFTRYQHDPDDPNSLGPGGIQVVFVDATGVIWLGITEGGLDMFDPTTGQFIHYRHNPEDPNSLRGDHVRAIYEDSADIFWVGTWHGLDQFERDTEQFRHVNDYRIITAYEDSSGVMWFGTVDDGLLRFDRESEQFKVFGSDPDDPNSLSDRAVSAILEDHTGAFWVGTWNGGLNKFDRETGNTQVFRHDGDDPGSMSHDRVEVLYEDQAGRLWIGNAIGVDRFDREDETFTHYAEVGEFVSSILEESAPPVQDVKLWFGTINGLVRFDPVTETFQTFNTSHGVQSDASLPGHFKSATGEMIFGNQTGFTSFYPDQISIDPYIPPVVLTNFKLLNEMVPIGGDSPLQQAIWETDHLTLSPEDDVITLEFTALSYANPAENLLQYKMEGFDADWSPAATNHSATYTNLDPGDYVFRVRGSNSDGVWNEEGTALGITVTPPWWETIWFRGGLILLLVAGLFGAYRWRVSSLEIRSRELEARVSEQTRQLDERVKELTTLLTVSQDVVSTLELEPLLNLILEQLKVVVDYDVGTIRRLKQDSMQLQAYQGLVSEDEKPSPR